MKTSGIPWFGIIIVLLLPAWAHAVVDGDFNGDGQYDCQDVDGLSFAILNDPSNVDFDLNGDGFVDTLDHQSWLIEAGVENIGAPFLPADGNLDGTVDAQDFSIWNDFKFTATIGFCSGDYRVSGAVDAQDFTLWNDFKFQSSDGQAVPEPASGWLMLALLGACLRKCRRG